METDLRSAALNAIEDGHFDDAERHLRALLAAEPDDGVATAILALCLAERDRLEAATVAASKAVTLEPFIPYTHWVLGALLVRRLRYKEALGPASEALRLAPDDPDNHGLLAQVHAGTERWAEALAQAEQGLATQPDHDGCANIRALALRQLGRADEASRAFADAAAANPLNAFAAAGKGWSALAVGRPEEADADFRDALMFDPQLEWAQEGLLATLKSRSPIYRQLLRYFIWMSLRSSRERTMFAVGGVLGYSFLRRVARAQPELAPFIWPVLIAYLLFVLLTWIADPLLEFMLSFDPEGKRLVKRDRLWGGRLVVACLTTAAALGITALITGSPSIGLTALGAAVLVIPVAGVFQCEPGWPRMVMGAYTSALAAMVLMMSVSNEALAGSLFVLTAFGAAIGSWLARWLGSITPAR